MASLRPRVLLAGFGKEPLRGRGGRGRERGKCGEGGGGGGGGGKIVTAQFR